MIWGVVAYWGVSVNLTNVLVAKVNTSLDIRAKRFKMSIIGSWSLFLRPLVLNKWLFDVNFWRLVSQ
jgi:hypothetical protein